MRTMSAAIVPADHRGRGSPDNRGAVAAAITMTTTTSSTKVTPEEALVRAMAVPELVMHVRI
jgi:hypothetical protein